MPSLPQLKPATRIAITLGFISATIVWIAHGLNLIPSPNAHVHKTRLAIVKTLGGTISGLASNSSGSNSALQRSVDLATRLNKDVLSVGVRGKSRYLAKTGGHEENWKSKQSDDQSNQAELEVFANKRLWGKLEVCFADKESTGLLGFMFPLSIVAFVSLLTTGFSWWVLNRSFRYLNPSKVVPKRVRSAFDTLTEGLVLIDNKHEIAHANKAFGEILDIEKGTDSLIGTSLNELGWKTQIDNGASAELPWFQCIDKEASVTGKILEIGEGDDRRKFFVNSAPIFGNENDCRGAMISFDDVTEMEKQKIELAAMVKTLRSSRDEVELQNEKLTFLASYDPLTECMNRRAFWIEFEKLWEDAEPLELSLMMIDVDHFKSFNDTYGHSFGDLVLKQLGKTLRDTVSGRGVVSRFGGEEFVVALAGMKIDEALELTNTIHKAIADIDVEGKTVTASIGFTNREFKAMDGQHMIDQADISLYAAKRSGRNRVMRFDECEANDDLALGSETSDAEQAAKDAEIPKDAVEGFLKAVEFRCEATADHSRRVARLCASVGKTFLKQEDIYRLEVAAQLHEIGKLGVPDSILNSNRQLSTDDWNVVNQSKRIGLQLAESVFADSVVPQIIEASQNMQSQQSTAQGNLSDESRTGNKSLDTSVAILAVCDEFDSLIHGSDTRNSLQVEAAITHIKEDTSKRFRADIVSKLVDHVEKYGAEQQLSRGRGMGESWPPELKSPIDSTLAEEIRAAGVDVSGSSSSKMPKPREAGGTSLDQEISETLKAAGVDLSGSSTRKMPKPKQSVGTSLDHEIGNTLKAAGVDVPSSTSYFSSKMPEPREPVGTSLDEEISKTMKLANELLGLADETRSVAANTDEAKVVDQKKSSKPS